MSFLQALVMIVIIIVIIYVTWGSGTGESLSLMDALILAAETGGLSMMASVFFSALPGLVMDMVVQMAIQMIITEIAGDNEMLAMVLNLAFMVGMSAWQGNVTYGSSPNTAPVGSYGDTGGAIIGQGGGSLNTISSGGSINPQGFQFTNMTSFNFSNVLNPVNLVKFAYGALKGIGSMQQMTIRALDEEIASDQAAYYAEQQQIRSETKEMQDWLDQYTTKSIDLKGAFQLGWKVNNIALGAEDFYKATCTDYVAMNTACFASQHDALNSIELMYA